MTTLFDSKVPTNKVVADTNSVELGMKWKSSTSGYIVGVRYYSGKMSSKPKTGSLWTFGGTRLAKATFPIQTKLGWQEVKFSTPVKVVAGTTYVVSYYANGGNYAGDAYQFNNPVTNGPLIGVNSCFSYSGASIFPVNNWHNTNYWVDVMFSADVTTPTPVPDPIPAPTPTPVPPAGVLVPGIAPQPGQVGYLGAVGDLKVINSAATAPPGTRWVDPGYLQIDSDTVTLDKVYVQGGVDYYGKGVLTVSNSIIEGGSAWFVLIGRSQGGHMTVTDSTLRWKTGAPYPSNWGNGAIHGDTTMTVQRCDISGTPDGIQNGPGNSLFDQNYIHNLAMIGTYPNNTHNDGIQFYGGPNIIVRYNRIDLGSFDGQHQNGALFFQGTFNSPEIIGNYLRGGGFFLRLESGVTGASVKNNTFGPLDTSWGYVLASQGTIGSWLNNKDSYGNLVPQP